MHNPTSCQSNHRRILPGWMLGICFVLLFAGYLFTEVAHAESTPQLHGTIPPVNSTIPNVGIFLPLVSSSPVHTPTADTGCPTVSSAVFSAIPVAGAPSSIPAEESPDFNLAQRGHIPTTAHLGLVNYNGPTDSDAPQIADVFAPPRVPVFTAAHQVYDWNWGCHLGQMSIAGRYGCRGEPLEFPEVTMLGTEVEPGEPLHIPSRRAEIHGGGYVALVLYATKNRLTLTYTREDTPAIGYMIHLEDICTDPNLLDLYQKLDAEGRHMLPAIHNGETVGTAFTDQFLFAVRDTGSFMDPRSHKDWWQDR